MAPLSLASLIGEISARLDRRLEKQERGPIDHSAENWASEIAHPCLRFLTYARTCWKDRKFKTTDSLYRLEDGRRFETAWDISLEESGVEVMEKGSKFSWPAYLIGGRIDGRLRIAGHDRRPPHEFKAVSPWIWDETETVNDIKTSRSFWVRRLLFQLVVYLLLMGEEVGILGIRTWGQRPRLLEVRLEDHLDLGDEALNRASAVNAAVDRCRKVGPQSGGDIFPPRIEYSPELCTRCDFDHLCLPVRPSIQGPIPAGLEEDARRFFELFPPWKEREKLHDKLIGSRKQPGVLYGKSGLFAEFAVSSRLIHTERLQVPDALRAQYLVADEYYRTKIEKL